MPLYFINLADDEIRIENCEAHELANLRAAETLALDLARHVMTTLSVGPNAFEHYELEIADEDGAILSRVPFRKAMPN